MPEDLDEGCEEIRDAFPQLLDVGVLISGALVSVDRNSLVDDFPKQVLLLAEGLHHELLEVFGEKLEAVLVGKDDHVPASLPVGQVVPGKG